MKCYEEYLFKKAKQGNIRAFEKLIQQHQKKVYTVFLKTIHNTEEASELTQKVFVQVFQSMNQFNNSGAVSDYIYKWTARTYSDIFCKRKDSGKHIGEAI